MRKGFYLLVAVSGILFLQPAQAQQSLAPLRNLDKIYRYPASFGIETQFPFPFTQLGTDYKGSFSMLDISLLTKFPLATKPALQPLLRLGVLLTRPEARENNENSSAFAFERYYAATGLQFMAKTSKEVELGGSLEAGIGYQNFSSLSLNDGQPVYSWNLHASLGPRLAISPSYNFSVNIQPSIGYSHALSPLERFNGFYISISVSLDYRIGRDPDKPLRDSGSIEFSRPQIRNLFAAMQSYYINNPFGEITITNVERSTLRDVEVSFFQPGYMRLPSNLITIQELPPLDSTTIPLTTLLDENIFEFEGVIPLTGEIRVDYTRGTTREFQVYPMSYDLYDKNSLTWDDDNKLGAFITSGDTALANYMSYLRRINRDVVNPGYNPALQTAIQVFHGLTEMELLYQKDPNLSYKDARGNNNFIDTVNIPRETLVKLSGDCDDLTVLYNALLEAAGIETGFITAPGHIYSMFNTNVDSNNYSLIHPDKKMTIPFNGKLWIPVEITYIGEFDFEDAWRSGIDEYYRYVDEGRTGVFFTGLAQKDFRPVGFRHITLNLQYGDDKNIKENFSRESVRFIDAVMDNYLRQTEATDNLESWNRLGIAAASLGRYTVALEALSQALLLNSDYRDAKSNIGSVYFLQGKYQQAIKQYQELESKLQETGETDQPIYLRLLVRIAQAHYEIENYVEAGKYIERLGAINPDLGEKFAYLKEEKGQW